MKKKWFDAVQKKLEVSKVNIEGENVNSTECWHCGERIEFISENKSFASTLDVVETIYACYHCNSLVCVEWEQEYFHPRKLITSEFLGNDLESKRINNRLSHTK